MNRKRLWLAAALLLPVLMAIAVLLADWIGAHPRAVTLADGRSVTVRGISSGTSHRFVYGNFWQRIAALALPARWAEKLGAVTYREITGSPAHVVWVDVGKAALPSVDKVWVADEYGTFIPAHLLSASLPSGSTIRPYMFFVMPTGSRKVEVILDTGNEPFVLLSLADRRQLGGSVHFKNPSYLRRPKWPNLPSPLVIDQDELRIQLDYFGSSHEVHELTLPEANDAGAEVQLGRIRGDPLSRNERRSRTELIFRVQDRSNATNQWSLHHMGVANEAGSEWVPGSQISRTTSTNTSLRFTGRLSTNNFWKLRLFFTRRPHPAVDKLSKRSAPYERTIELIAQPTGGF